MTNMTKDVIMPPAANNIIMSNALIPDSSVLFDERIYLGVDVFRLIDTI